MGVSAAQKYMQVKMRRNNTTVSSTIKSGDSDSSKHSPIREYMWITAKMM